MRRMNRTAVLSLGIVLGCLLGITLTIPTIVRSQISVIGGLTGAGITPISTAVGSASSYGSVSVGTTAVTVRSSTSTRTSVTVQNNSNNTVYCGSDSNVVAGGAGTANSGIVLASGTPGGSYTWDRHTGAIVCIASGAASDVRYWESTTQ